MRAIVVVCILGLSSPAFAAPCFKSEMGDLLTFVEDGENSVSIKARDGSDLACSWMVTPDRADYQDIRCVGGLGGGFHFEEVPGKGRAMIFEDQVWDDAECAN